MMRPTMRFLLLCPILLLCTWAGAVDYKSLIVSCQSDLAKVEADQRGQLLLNLAISYYKDQSHEQAFKTFLEALDSIEKKEGEALGQADQAIYESALTLYLDPHAKPQETAVLLREKFAASYEKNPRNYGLGFILASCYANLHLFEDFFTCYYKAYQLQPHHFLAYKTKAILYLKLFEMSRTLEEREQMREKIHANAEQALALNPADSSLYKFVIQFAPAANPAVDDVLMKIIENDATISRSDIPFYVQKAIELKKFELAQRFLDAMRQHYPSSRLLASTQQLLDKNKDE